MFGHLQPAPARRPAPRSSRNRRCPADRARSDDCPPDPRPQECVLPWCPVCAVEIRGIGDARTLAEFTGYPEISKQLRRPSGTERWPATTDCVPPCRTRAYRGLRRRPARRCTLPPGVVHATFASRLSIEMKRTTRKSHPLQLAAMPQRQECDKHEGVERPGRPKRVFQPHALARPNERQLQDLGDQFGLDRQFLQL